MAWDALEFVHVEAEFLELGGGEIWERVEQAAWRYVQRERERDRERSRMLRAQPMWRAIRNEQRRRHYAAIKPLEAAVRCCKVCRAMYTVKLPQHRRGTRFCSRSCAARHRQNGRPIKPARTVTIGDKTRSIVSWSKIFGVKYLTVMDRIRRGMSPEEALRARLKPHAERDKSRYMVNINGEMGLLRDFAKGVTAQTVRRRIRKGMSIDQALNAAKQTPIRKPRMITIDGERRDIREWARHFGISYSAVTLRMRSGMTEIEALRASKLSCSRMITINNEARPLSHWARDYGISISTVYQRLRKGMNAVEAITRPKETA